MDHKTVLYEHVVHCTCSNYCVSSITHIIELINDLQHVFEYVIDIEVQICTCYWTDNM